MQCCQFANAKFRRIIKAVPERTSAHAKHLSQLLFIVVQNNKLLCNGCLEFAGFHLHGGRLLFRHRHDDGKEQPETEKPEVQTPATKQVRIVCASGSVNIRVGNDTKYSRITSVKDGATFEWIATAENGWHAIVVNAQVGWVSGKYSQVV